VCSGARRGTRGDWQDSGTLCVTAPEGTSWLQRGHLRVPPCSLIRALVLFCVLRLWTGRLQRGQDHRGPRGLHESVAHYWQQSVTHSSWLYWLLLLSVTARYGPYGPLSVTTRYEPYGPLSVTTRYEPYGPRLRLRGTGRRERLQDTGGTGRCQSLQDTGRDGHCKIRAVRAAVSGCKIRAVQAAISDCKIRAVRAAATHCKLSCCYSRVRALLRAPHALLLLSYWCSGATASSSRTACSE
jgi:hypothetical protein